MTEDAMRWGHNPESPLGSERVVTKFLLLPKRIGLETRWLEKATIQQMYIAKRDGYDYWRDWVDIKWMNP